MGRDGETSAMYRAIGRRMLRRGGDAPAGVGALGAALVAAATVAFGCLAKPVISAHSDIYRTIALYPREARRLMHDEDYRRYPGAGVLTCQTEWGAPARAAAAWLVGDRGLVVLNAHNFVDRRLRPTRPVGDCFFTIGDRDYEFEPDSLHFGFAADSESLHITDDWAVIRLRDMVDSRIEPQPVPDGPPLPSGSGAMRVVMVSPAGHANFRRETSIEDCEIRQIDAPSEGGVRRVRHDCNDGYGGSGSGLFGADGRLLAMHSASLDMNQRRDFDIERHYGMALLFEGAIVDAIRDNMRKEIK